MKKILIAFLLIFSGVQLFGQPKISNPKLKTLIDSLYIVDQQVQQDAIEAFQRSGLMDTFMVYEKIEMQTFERHIPIIKSIYNKNGYPTIDKVGKESSSKFFTLIQHADKDVNFQASMLPRLKQQVDKKQITGREYAYLYDRVQINNGKEQLYGTQLDYDEKGNAIPKKLKYKNNVNKRRKEFKMETLEVYLAKATGAHKRQNQAN